MSVTAFDRLVSSGDYFTRLVDIAGRPSISALSTVQDGLAITITGTNFSASLNRVFLGLPGEEIEIGVVSEGTTSIVTEVISSVFYYLTRANQIYVMDSSGVISTVAAATILPATGESATAIAQDFLGDPTTRASADIELVLGDEIRVKNVVGGTIADVVVTGQGAFVVDDDVTAFDYAIQDGDQLGDFATVSWTAPVATVNPPDIHNLTQGGAFTAVQAAGLVPVLVTSQQSSTVARGLVAAQFPESTATVEVGSVVEITMSLGVTGTIVPNLNGFLRQDAEAIRLAAGLIGSSLRIIDGNNSGLVLNQSLAPGEEVDVGTVLDISYSTNLAPSVRRLTPVEAQALLASAGLVYAESVSVFDASTAIGKVSAQLPAADSVVAAGATITVNLSLGAAGSALGLSGPGVSSAGVSGPGVSIGTTSNPIGTTADSTLVTADSTTITADQT